MVFRTRPHSAPRVGGIPGAHHHHVGVIVPILGFHIWQCLGCPCSECDLNTIYHYLYAISWEIVEIYNNNNNNNNNNLMIYLQ